MGEQMVCWNLNYTIITRSVCTSSALRMVLGIPLLVTIVLVAISASMESRAASAVLSMRARGIVSLTISPELV